MDLLLNAIWSPVRFRRESQEISGRIVLVCVVYSWHLVLLEKKSPSICPPRQADLNDVSNKFLD